MAAAAPAEPLAPAALLRALQLTRGPAGRFLLGGDAVVDLGILRDSHAVDAAVVHAGTRSTSDRAEPPTRLSAMRVPFVNIGAINVGLAIGKVGGSGGGLETNMMTRTRGVMGRYATDTRTGEMLTVLTDVRPSGRSKISLLWIGPAQSEYVRQRVDIVCEAELFASGRLAESVIRLERTTRIGGGKAAGLMPTGPRDMDKFRMNIAHYAGLCHDFQEGRPAFEEQLTVVKNMGLQRMLMGVCVQYKLADLMPGRLGLEAPVELYQMALRISERRLSELNGPVAVQATEREFIGDAAIVAEQQSSSQHHQENSCFEDDHELADTRESVASSANIPSGCDEEIPSAQMVEAACGALTAGWQSHESGRMGANGIADYLIDDEAVLRPGTGASSQNEPTTTLRSQQGSLEHTAEDASAVDSVEHRKAVRRAKNILAAKRSNARRREAYRELERSLALAQRTVKRLRERDAELRCLNADMRKALRQL